MSDTPNPQTFEGWAHLSARLRTMQPAAQRGLLTSLQLHASWPQIDAYWRAVLIEDIARGHDTRCSYFQRACHAASRSDVPAASPAPVMQAPAAPVAAPSPQAATRPTAPPTSHASTPTPVAPATPPSLPPSVAPVVPSSMPAPAPPVMQKTTTTCMSSVPQAVVDDAQKSDFRRALMRNVNQRAEAEAAPTSVGDERSFVDRLSPQVDVNAPTLRQESTQALSTGADAEAMATLALGWPIERYAKVTAHAEREPYRAELIWAAHGVKGKHLPRVLKSWRLRFQDDPALEAQWRELVQQHLQES